MKRGQPKTYYAIFLSALIVVGFVIFGKVGRFPIPQHPLDSDAKNYAPIDTAKQTEPRHQAGLVPTAPDADILPLPSAQQGLTVSDAKEVLEVGTSIDTPAFNKTDLKAKADEVVSLTFTNNSLPKFEYHHSWVLVQPGTEGEVAIAADRAGSQNDFIPDSPQVIARTRRLLAPGESETIIFRTPKTPGHYPFICTYPGHSAAMKGTLHVMK